MANPVLVNGRIERGWMWTAVDRAWLEMGQRVVERHPGWSVEYELLGFTLTRAGDGHRITHVPYRMLDARMDAADREASPS